MSIKKVFFCSFFLFVFIFFALQSANANIKTPVFDRNIKKFPSNYSGDNFQNVFNKYSGKGGIKKGAYESNDEYQKRINANKSDIYAFSKKLPLSSIKARDLIKYDTEDQTFSTLLDSSPELSSWSKQTGTYIATDSRGSNIKVTKYDREASYLKFNNYDRNNFNIEFRYPLADAKKLSEDLRALFIINPIEAGVSEWTQEPTRAIPSEIKQKHYVIKGNVQEVWIYDYKTGIIFYKLLVERRQEEDPKEKEKEAQQRRAEEKRKQIEQKREATLQIIMDNAVQELTGRQQWKSDWKKWDHFYGRDIFWGYYDAASVTRGIGKLFEDKWDFVILIFLNKESADASYILDELKKDDGRKESDPSKGGGSVKAYFTLASIAIKDSPNTSNAKVLRIIRLLDYDENGRIIYKYDPKPTDILRYSTLKLIYDNVVKNIFNKGYLV